MVAPLPVRFLGTIFLICKIPMLANVPSKHPKSDNFQLKNVAFLDESTVHLQRITNRINTDLQNCVGRSSNMILHSKRVK